MKRNAVEFEYPEELLLSLKDTEEEMSRRLKMAAAVKLFELGKISSGYAACLAGMSRGDFLRNLGGYRVSIFQQSDDEIEEDLKNA